MTTRHRVLWGSVLLLMASAVAAAQIPEMPWKEKAPEALPAPPSEDVDAIAAQVRAMSLRERVAQLMLVTLEGRAGPDAEDRALLENYTPGGVVIPVLSRPENAALYVRSLRGYEARRGIPLWVGADLFLLGRGERNAPSAFMQLPSPLSIAATNDAEAARFLADVIGEFLATMAFNLYLGPSLELAPVVADAQGTIQSFGSDAAFIGNVACAFLDTLGERGIAAMPMGFPGGGANQEGKTAPVLLTPRAHLAANDLLPFARAVEHGATLLHVGPVLTPTLDAASRPACVSAAVIGGLLRGELGFTGVVVAGPLDAAHVAATYDAPDAAVQALLAGADMLYWNEAGRRVMRVVDELVKAVEAGQVSESVVNGALRRILSAKRDAAILGREIPKGKEAAKLNKQRDYAKEAARFERRSITLVQNANRTLPLTKKDSLPVGVTGVLGVREMCEKLGKRLKSVTMQPIATAARLGDIQDFEIDRVISRLEGVRTAVCILSDELRVPGAAQLVRALKEHGVRVVVVLLGYPRMLPQLSEADAIVLAYCDRSAFLKTLDVVCDALLGEAPVAVDPPAQDVHVKTGETHTFSILSLARCPAARLPVSVTDAYPAGLAVSYDVADAVKRVEWDFGDGKRGKGLRVEHAYTEAGRYPVTVSVADVTGDETSRTWHVVAE